MPRPRSNPFSPSSEPEAKAANETQAKTLFGKGGSKIAQLTGYDKLNTQQKDEAESMLESLVKGDPMAIKAMSEADLKKHAQDAVDKAAALAKTTLAPQVNVLVEKSETLKTAVVKLQKAQWDIKLGEAGKGSSCQKSATPTGKGVIVIDPTEDPISAATTLAHEMGHAEYTPPPTPSLAASASAEAYVLAKVESNFLDEGNAQFVACKVAKELQAKGEATAKAPADGDGKFMAVYEKQVKGEITYEAAIKDMAKLFSGLVTSTTKEDYYTYYGNYYLEQWNDNLPATATPATLPPKTSMFGGTMTA